MPFFERSPKYFYQLLLEIINADEYLRYAELDEPVDVMLDDRFGTYFQHGFRRYVGKRPLSFAAAPPAMISAVNGNRLRTFFFRSDNVNQFKSVVNDRDQVNIRLLEFLYLIHRVFRRLQILEPGIHKPGCRI